MQQKLEEKRNASLNYLLAKFKDLKFGTKFRFFGTKSQIRMKNNENIQNARISTANDFFTSTSTVKNRIKNYPTIKSNHKKTNTVIFNIHNKDTQEFKINEVSISNDKISDSCEINDYRSFGYKSANISKSLKNCSGRNIKVDQVNANFHLYIQNELIRRSKLTERKERSVPVTRAIVKDLNKKIKDPLSTTANKEFPKISLSKMNDY